MNLASIRHHKLFHKAYYIGIAIKGFDGAVEFLAGAALLVSPTIVHDVLSAVVGHAAAHDSMLWRWIGEYVGRLDNDLQRAGLTFLIIFLLGHGIVKLVLVYCLLRRIVWAYPYALGVLGLFLLYQLIVTLQDPGSLGLWFFCILDAAIIWLVWGEWKDLREEVERGARPRKNTEKTV